MSIFFRKRPDHKKLKIMLACIVICLIGFGSYVLILNRQHKDRNEHVEITFVNSHQAVVFWTTQKETIGYVKYGLKEHALEKVAKQTSSAKGTTHAVVIEDIPIEGVYISLHNETDSPLLFAKTQRIVFDAEKYIE